MNDLVSGSANSGAADDFARRHRLDLKFERSVDAVSGVERMLVVLDPARYKVVEGANEPMVIDRLDSSAIPLREVQRMIHEAMTKIPTGCGQRLGDARTYIERRRAGIRTRLKDHGAPLYALVDRSEDYLASVHDGVHGFAILSVDLVGSTALSNSLDAMANARVIGVVLEEFAAVLPHFHAHILKFTGDGVLTYIPPPSFLTANDNAIDCALTVRGLVRDAINPELADLGYPVLDVRIGIESGAAVALSVGHISSKRQRDLIGKTLNLACKIQASAGPGEIRIGQVAYQNMHTMWQRGCARVPRPEGWSYTLADGGEYQLYTFTATGAITE